MTFEELKLVPELLQALASRGYTEPTPIQAQAIPLLLAGKDLIGSAQTGTGKTAAFVLPALQRLAVSGTRATASRHGVASPRILVLAPTRELAQQVAGEAVRYGRSLRVNTVCIYGGAPYPVQNRELARGADIIAIDGTGIRSSDVRHCATCLTQEHKDGTTTYYHTVLEAKQVTPDGLVFSVASEFVENADPNASKQDCELKALYRLLPRLKERFPRARTCLLLDSLYANDPVLKLCEELGWRYMITFKEGSAPAAYADFQTLLRLQKDNRLTVNHGEETQHLAWVTRLSWQKHHCNVLQCRVVRTTGTETCFVWITDLELNPRNVETIANDGGRCRWKIENEGFNAQKNGEFHIEHPLGCQGQAWKNFYLLAQVAHLLQQLMYRWRALRVVRECVGAVYRFIRKFAQDMCTLMPPGEDTVEPAFQLRLDAS